MHHGISNKTLSQKETSSNKLAPPNSIVDSVLRNPSITSLNLRLGSSSPEEETVSHCNEVQNPHERLDNVDPLSNDNFARSNSNAKEEKLTNGLEVHDDSSKIIFKSRINHIHLLFVLFYLVG